MISNNDSRDPLKSLHERSRNFSAVVNENLNLNTVLENRIKETNVEYKFYKITVFAKAIRL